MKKLLSIPPNLVEHFNELEKLGRDEWFCTSDPVGKRVGSGGGTAWLLNACHREEAPEVPFETWLSRDKRILLHAGGQSRRLPAYAPAGKILTPVPVFRWERGQQLRQNLLSLQVPFYEELMSKAPDSLHTLVASGDVYLRSEATLPAIPEADVVCLGMWTDLSLATRHGVFASLRESPGRLDFMLQKPSLQTLEGLSASHFIVMDIGVWLLSDRAVEVLLRRSYTLNGESDAITGQQLPAFYDLYADFGAALGDRPGFLDNQRSAVDVSDEQTVSRYPKYSTGDHVNEINELSVAIVPLTSGEFYHYGTSRELITSTLSLQNKVYDQRKVLQRKVKPHPAMFVQNALVKVLLLPENDTLWVENSVVGARWKLKREHVITGVPDNDWELKLETGMCVDVLYSSTVLQRSDALLPPMPENSESTGTSPTKVLAHWSAGELMYYIPRVYGIDDAFRGAKDAALWMGRPVTEWMDQRRITTVELPDFQDMQLAKLFPVVENIDDLGSVIRWMTTEPDLQEGRKLWLSSPKFSADDLMDSTDLKTLYRQRTELFRLNLPVLAANYDRSVFYQSDLVDIAREWTAADLKLPEVLPPSAGLLHRMHNRMFRAKCYSIIAAKENDVSMSEYAGAERSEAFSLMRKALLDEVKVSDASMSSQESLNATPLSMTATRIPKLNVLTDQIVWSRSPVRIDLAGGWTDTPPYSLYAGGAVVNVAINLNGQQPLQVYLKPSSEPVIILRSIDMGAFEVVANYEELQQFNRVGSPFSIPKAALSLAGFSPDSGCGSLKQQLEIFGAGIELTLLAAIPAGSGLGTSSLLASTVLGGINDFCGLGWDKNAICLRTLALEQLLTTGGGWQDQYGGVLQGVKLLQTEAGLRQSPSVNWLPDYIFTQPEYSSCHLLYYTGITRTAKHILAEIVEGMFLNSSYHLQLLAQMKDHASEMASAIQRGDIQQYGRLIATTWSQNKALDNGTNPPAIEAIIQQVNDLTNGYKLPGAGGGGYLYMVAKDPEAAARIRLQLSANQPNPRARFVEMNISQNGLQISRS